MTWEEPICDILVNCTHVALSHMYHPLHKTKLEKCDTSYVSSFAWDKTWKMCYITKHSNHTIDEKMEESILWEEACCL